MASSYDVVVIGSGPAGIRLRQSAPLNLASPPRVLKSG